MSDGGIPRPGARPSSALPGDVRQEAFGNTPDGILGNYQEAAKHIIENFDALSKSAADSGKSMDVYYKILEKANKESKLASDYKRLEAEASAQARKEMAEHTQAVKDTADAYKKAGRDVLSGVNKLNDWLSSPLTAVDALLKLPFQLIAGAMADGKIKKQKAEEKARAEELAVEAKMDYDANARLEEGKRAEAKATADAEAATAAADVASGGAGGLVPAGQGPGLGPIFGAFLQASLAWYMSPASTPVGQFLMSLISPDLSGAASGPGSSGDDYADYVIESIGPILEQLALPAPEQLALPAPEDDYAGYVIEDIAPALEQLAMPAPDQPDLAEAEQLAQPSPEDAVGDQAAAAMAGLGGEERSSGAVDGLMKHYLEVATKWYEAPAGSKVGQFYKSLFPKATAGSGDMGDNSLMAVLGAVIAAAIVGAIFILKDGLIPLLQAVAYAITIIADLVKALTPVVVQFAQALLRIFLAIEPYLVTFLKVLITFATTLVQMLTTLITPIGNAITAALEIVTSVLRSIGAGIDGLASIFKFVGDIFKAGSAVVGGVAQVAGATAGAASDVVTAGGKAVADRMPQILDGILKVMDDMWDGTKKFFDVVMEPIRAAMTALSSLITAVGAGLTTFVNETLGVLTDVMSDLRFMLSGPTGWWDALTGNEKPKSGSGSRPTDQKAQSTTINVNNQFSASYSEMSPFGFNAFQAVGGL